MSSKLSGERARVRIWITTPFFFFSPCIRVHYTNKKKREEYKHFQPTKYTEAFYDEKPLGNSIKFNMLRLKFCKYEYFFIDYARRKRFSFLRKRYTEEVWLAKENLLTGRVEGREGEKKRRTSSLFFYVLHHHNEKEEKETYVYGERENFCRCCCCCSRTRARARRETDVM